MDHLAHGAALVSQHNRCGRDLVVEEMGPLPLRCLDRPGNYRWADLHWHMVCLLHVPALGNPRLDAQNEMELF